MGGATVAGDKDNDTMAMINKHAFSLAHTHTLCVLAESEWTRMVHSSTQRADRSLTRRVFRRLCGCVAVRNTACKAVQKLKDEALGMVMHQ